MRSIITPGLPGAGTAPFSATGRVTPHAQTTDPAGIRATVTLGAAARTGRGAAR